MTDYVLTKVVHFEKKTKTPCHHCGYKGLKNLYYLRDDNGIEIIVGSECAPHLLSGVNLDRFNDYLVYLKQITEEFKNNSPPIHEDEGKEEYFNRRLMEIGNSGLAKQEWDSIVSIFLETKRRLLAKGIENPLDVANNINTIGINSADYSWEETPAKKDFLTRSRQYEKMGYIEQLNILKEIADKYNTTPNDILDTYYLIKSIRVLDEWMKHEKG